jgi:hypothetical protein
VEAGVEDRDVRHVREDALRLLDPRESWSVVERGECLELEDLLADDLIDHNGIAEAWAALHDAMADGLDICGVDRLERIQCGRALVRGDQVELEARRAGVDDEDVQ